MSRTKLILVPVLALGLSGLTQTSAQALVDTTAPVLTSYTVAPTSLDVTRGSQTAVLVLRISDDDSGFNTGSVTLTKPGGGTLEKVPLDGSRVSGTANDGTYDAYVQLPQGSPGGGYLVSDITLSDVLNNTSHYTSADPVAADVLAVTRTADSAAPALVGSISATPSAVNTTNASREVIYSARLTDAVSGVANAQLTFTGPPRPDDLGAVPTTLTVPLLLATGTPNDGTWIASRSFLPGQERGTWTPTELVLTDGYENTTTPAISTGLSGEVTVTGSDDIKAPALISLTPLSTVDTTKTAKTITVSAGITDAVSGLRTGFFTWTALDGLTTVSGSTDVRTSGTAQDGTYTVPVSFPVRSPAGTWTLTSILLSDEYGNFTDLATGDPGLPASTITVTTTPDSTGPALVAFSLGPDTVSTAFAGGQLFGHLTATDGVSGIASARVTFKDPSGADVPSLDTFLFLTEGVPGNTPENATFHFSVFLPETAAAGAWTVAGIELTDVAGATRTITTAELPEGERGFTVVTTGGDTTAPTLTALAVSPTSVNTTTGEQQVAVTVSATDSGSVPSGLSFLSMELTSPSTAQSVFASVTTNELISGDAVAGTYRTTVLLPKYSETGTWVVSQVTAIDRAERLRTLLQGDLAALGLTTTLSVTGASDTVAPVLTGLTLNTPSISTADTSSLRFTATGTDNSSGIGLVKVTLAGPGGLTATGTGLGFSSEPGEVSVELDRFNSTGSWSTSEVTVTDRQGNARTYTAAELSALGLSRTASVTGVTDTEAPELAGLKITPTSVNSTNGEVAADVLVHVTDAVSGVASVELSVTSPNAVQTLQVEPNLITGDGLDGWYQGTLTFPRFVDPGTWTVGPLVVKDGAGNTLTRTSTQLSAASLQGTLSVIGAIDAVPPNLTTLTVTPSPVDTTTGHKTLTVSLGVADADSGAAVVSVRAVAPSGDSQTVTAERFSGDAAAGVWRGTVELPPYSETGSWTFDQASLRDVYGNVRSYTNAQLVSAGVASTGFTVTGTPDTIGPVLTGLTLTPSTVDVSVGGVSISGSLTATDAESGISGGFLTYTSPNGNQTISASVDAFSRTAGTINGPTMPIAMQVPRFAQQGSWTLSSVDLFDRAGNSTRYPPRALPGGGVATAIQVVDINEDLTPPTVLDVTPSPVPLDVRTTPGTLTVDVRVTDAGSGVKEGDVSLDSPSGQDSRFAHWSPDHRISGTAADGVYRVSFPFASATESGLWSISLAVGDVAGNVTSYTGAAVPGVRLVQITGIPIAPAAPTDVEASPGNTMVSLSWVAPSNGGSPISSYTVTPTKDGVAQTAITGITESFTRVTGLTNGSSYSFVVTATNSVGTGAASAPSAAVVPAPTAPAQPVVTSANAGDGKVDLAWTAPTDNGGLVVTGYRVTTFSASFVPLVTQDIGNVLAHSITGLTNGNGYHFAVRAVNGVGVGDAWFTDLVTPSAAPTAPSAPPVVTAALSSPTGATVTWTPPANGGSAIIDYVVTEYVDGVEQPFTAVTVAGSSTQQVMTGLTKGTTYTFKVRARNIIGAGPQSAASNPVAIPAVVPGVPTGVIGNAGNGQVALTWTAPGDSGGRAILSYVVTPFIGGVAQTPITGVTGTSTRVGLLTNGTAYTFTVHAVNSIGAGGESVGSAPVTPAAGPGTSAAPVAVAGNASATVTWNAPAVTGGAAIIGYVVMPYRSGVAQTPVFTGNVLTTVVTSLTNGPAYTFTVRAVNAVGAGAESPQSAVVTPRVPTRVVITSAPTLSTYATAIKVVGKLTRTDTGAALAGQAVQLQVRKKGSTGAFSTVATATSTSVGVVTFTTYKPLTGVQLRLVRPVVAGNGFGTSTSLSKVVSCQMKVTANLSALSITFGRSVTLSGVVAPNHRGKVIFLQRKIGTRWLPVTSKVLTKTSGYGFIIKPTTKGTFSYRVMMKADVTYVVSYAVARPLRVT